MENHDDLQICPCCGGVNVSYYESGHYKIVHCSDCDATYELHKIKKDLIKQAANSR
jgi:hypothetical protein